MGNSAGHATRYAREAPVEGTFVEIGNYQPVLLTAARLGGKPAQLYGDVWERTQSAYAPYRGFHPETGSLGEYNGKVTCDQYVLRGGSCATLRAHVRATCRTFFPASARWPCYPLPQPEAPCA